MEKFSLASGHKNYLNFWYEARIVSDQEDNNRIIPRQSMIIDDCEPITQEQSTKNDYRNHHMIEYMNKLNF